MDKLFTLDKIHSDNHGVPGYVVENVFKVESETYSRNISNEIFYNDKVFLELLVWKGEKLKLRDFFKWGNGRPNANTTVCSPKFKSVLETLNLPRHTFYPAEIEAGKKTHNYFVLHYINNYLEDIDYKNSQFAVGELINYKPIKHTFQIGEITDFENYKEIEAKLVNNMEWIFPLKIKFLPDKHYDLWNFNGQHIITETALEKITAANITGLVMPPLAETELNFLEIS